jgi:hypothetical protein
MAGSAPNFNHRYIYLLRIFYGFFTSPLYEMFFIICLKYFFSSRNVIHAKGMLSIHNMYMYGQFSQ